MDYNEQSKKIEEQSKLFNEQTTTVISEGERMSEKDFALSVIKVQSTYTRILSEIDKTVGWLVDNCNLKTKENVRSDFEKTLRNFLGLTRTYFISIVKAIKETNTAPVPEPSTFSYSNVQKYFSTFSSTEIVQQTRKVFEELGIDTSGYHEKFDTSAIENKEKEIQMDKERKEAEKLEEKKAKEAQQKQETKAKADEAAQKQVAKRRKISIIVGFICIVIVLSILLIKKPPYAQFLQICLQILFAVGIGGISAALIGSFRWRFLQTVPIDLVGGIGLAIYLLSTGIKPWIPIPPPILEFSSTIELKYNKDQNVSGTSSVDLIQLRFNGSNQSGELKPLSGVYEWPHIPIVYEDSLLELTLTSKRWRFEGNRKTIDYRLKMGANVLNVIKDTLNNRIFGVVTFTGPIKNKKPNVVIYLSEDPALRAVPDEYGKWAINLPEQMDAGLAKVVVMRNNIIFRKPTLYTAGVSIPIQIPY